MDYEYLLVEQKQGVGYVTLNRPKQYGSLNAEACKELTDVLTLWKDDPEVKVIVLAGTGRAFCTGMEMKPELFNTVEMPLDLGKVLEKHFNPILKLITEMPKIIICSVNGIAAGIGASLPLLADITLAGKSAAFAQIFSKIGLIPDGGITWYLPRLIGYAKAKALMLTAEKISADEAERLGMIYKVVEDDELKNEVEKLATHLAKQATVSLALIKKAMQVTMQNDFTEQLRVEQELQCIAGQTEDFFEGARAFMMKDEPNFKGR